MSSNPDIISPAEQTAEQFAADSDPSEGQSADNSNSSPKKLLLPKPTIPSLSEYDDDENDDAVRSLNESNDNLPLQQASRKNPHTVEIDYNAPKDYSTAFEYPRFNADHSAVISSDAANNDINDNTANVNKLVKPDEVVAGRINQVENQGAVNENLVVNNIFLKDVASAQVIENQTHKNGVPLSSSSYVGFATRRDDGHTGQKNNFQETVLLPDFGVSNSANEIYLQKLENNQKNVEINVTEEFLMNQQLLMNTPDMQLKVNGPMQEVKGNGANNRLILSYEEEPGAIESGSHGNQVIHNYVTSKLDDMDSVLTDEFDGSDVEKNSTTVQKGVIVPAKITSNNLQNFKCRGKFSLKKNRMLFYAVAGIIVAATNRT